MSSSFCWKKVILSVIAANVEYAPHTADDSEGSGDENTESTVVGGKKLRRNRK